MARSYSQSSIILLGYFAICSTTDPVTVSNSLQGNGTDLTLATRNHNPRLCQDSRSELVTASNMWTGHAFPGFKLRFPQVEHWHCQ